MHLCFRDLRKAKEPVGLHEEVSLPRIAEDNAQVTGISPVQCDIEIDVSNHLFHVHGIARAVVTYACSRCLVPFHSPLQAVLDERFTDDASQADDELHLVTEDELDFDPFVEQAVNLEIEYCPVCRDDCKGLCPVCGCNRNEHTCSCETQTLDPRFAALQDLLSSDKSK